MTTELRLLPDTEKFARQKQKFAEELQSAYAAGIAAGLDEAASQIYMLAHNTSATGLEIGYRDQLKIRHDLLLLMADRYARIARRND